MKKGTIIPLVIILGLALTLVIGLSVSAQNQDTEQAPAPLPERPQLADEPAGSFGSLDAADTVSHTFSYQGILKEDGQPVSGDREMIFRLYANEVCTDVVGSPLTYTVPVSQGLFTVDLSFDQAHFNGQALWLEVEAQGTSVGCQPLQTVPYALGLRPGAVISRALSSDPMLSVRGGDVGGEEPYALIDMMGTGASLFVAANDFRTVGIWGVIDNETYVSTGVYGRSDSLHGRGVVGSATYTGTSTRGVWGLADSPDGRGGFFENTADGDPGFALAAEGRHGVIVTSTHGTTLLATGAGNSSIGDDGVRGEHSGDGVVGESLGTLDLDNGVIGYSAGGYGVYGFSLGTDQYGGYFNDPIFVNGGCTGCTLLYVARNVSESDLQLGDLIRVAGVETELEGLQNPVMRVTPVSDGRPALGVVVGRTDVTVPQPNLDDVQPGAHFGPTGGTAAPGDYVVILVQGMAQVRVDPAAEIQPGQVVYASQTGLTDAAAGSPFGTALDGVDADGLVWVLVGTD